MAGCAPPNRDTAWSHVSIFAADRSNPDQVDWGTWRGSVNWSFPEGRLARRAGWRKWGWWYSDATNSDLHSHQPEFIWRYRTATGDDSGVTTWPNALCGDYQDDSVPEPYTSGINYILPSGTPVLLVGTRTRIYEWQSGGRWRVLASYRAQEGQDDVGVRFQFAGVNEVIFAVNDNDQPLAYIVGAALSGCQPSAFHPVPALASIGLARAGMVVAWRNTIFLGNVLMDGLRVGHRLVWSNANAPLEWEPNDDSTAGFQDLNSGETILRGVVIGDSLFIFATHSVWRIDATPEGFTAAQVYFAADRAGCLWAPHSLAVTPDAQAVYLGTGRRVFLWSPFSPAPQEPDWISRSTADLARIPDAACRSVSGVYRDDLREYLLSYPRAGTPDSTVPDRCLALDLDNTASSAVDHGFWMLLNVTLRDEETLRDWLIAQGICDEAGVDAIWPPVNVLPPGPTRTFRSVPAGPTGPIFSTFTRFIAIPEGSATITTEDPARAGEVSGSGLLCEQVESPLAPCPPCPSTVRVLACSATDGSLKHLNAGVYYRERWTGSGYANDGYVSPLLTGAMTFGKPTVRKRMVHLTVGYVAAAEHPAARMRLTIGSSDMPAEPISSIPQCQIRWTTLSTKEVVCHPSEYAGAMRWSFMAQGKYLYLRLEVQPDAAAGGKIIITSLSAGVGQSPDSTP